MKSRKDDRRDADEVLSRVALVTVALACFAGCSNVPAGASASAPTPDGSAAAADNDAATSDSGGRPDAADGGSTSTRDAGDVFAPTNTPRMGLSNVYPTTYADWTSGFLAGNGTMGIIVFGNPLDETVVFNDRGFNMAATNPRSFNQVSASDLATIKSETIAGDYATADDLAVSSAGWNGGGEGNRHPGFEMLITIPPNGTVTNYSRTCNYRTGEIAVNWTDGVGNWVRKAFVSRSDDVDVQYLTAPSGGKLNCSIQLAIDPAMDMPSSMTFTNVSSVDYLGMQATYGPGTNGAGYEGETRVVTTGGTKSLVGNVLTISGADSVILLTRTAKYYSDAASVWTNTPIQTALATIPTDYDTLLSRQIATHEAIYDRTALDLNASAIDRARSNDDLLSMQAASSVPVKALWERVFDAGRYHFLSSSSAETPPDLLGIWTGDTNAGWGGFYTLDANLNLQIAGGNVGDMPEAMAGYFTLIQTWRSDFETNASMLLGCRGMLSCGNSPGPTTGLMASISTYYPYQYATAETAWLLYPFWEHYLITGDVQFLQTQLYPMLSEMGDFYQDFLVNTDSNGHYIFAGSVSPENQPSNVAVSLLNNSSFDIAGAKWLLATLVQAATILGLEQGAGAGVERWTNMLNVLPPYLINTDGALQEWSWPGLLDNYDHRHSSHLIGVWPFREITPEGDPVYFSGALNALRMRDMYNYENAGHGLLHAALIAANLKNVESLTAKLMTLTSAGYYYDSLASSHYNDNSVFCTDTANAIPGVMIEMLVSSSPGILELLPALPTALDTGTIWDVKGRNRVTVEQLTWNMGTGTLACVLKSDIDQDLTLIERAGIQTISTDAQVSASPLGPIARVVHLTAGVVTPISIGIAQLSDAGELGEGGD
jgi:alpha-L-fucosidase 2